MKTHHTLKLAGLLACTFLATAGFSSAQEAATKIPADLEARRAAAMKKAELIREELMKAANAPRPQLTQGQRDQIAATQEAAEKDLASKHLENKMRMSSLKAEEKERDHYFGEVLRRLEEATRQKITVMSEDLKKKKIVEEKAAEEILARTGAPLIWVGKDGMSRRVDGIEGGKPIFVGSHNIISAETISTPALKPSGKLRLNLTGLGTKLGVWEIADPTLSHTEFYNTAGTTLRILDIDGVRTGTTQGDKDHATHVSGTMVARGMDASAQGMSPEATLHAYDQLDDLIEMSTIFSNSDPTDNIQLSNHSYGGFAGWDSQPYEAAPGIFIPWWYGDFDTNVVEDPSFGFYGSHAQTIDALVFLRKTYLPIWAAGNDRLQTNPAAYGNYYVAFRSNGPQGAGYYIVQGTYPPADGNPSGYDTVFREGVAKNILTVASVADLPGGFTTTSTVTPSWFSNAGPTDDGRIKPDIAANGESLFSSGDSSSYLSYTGTSMAAPSVAGSLNLLTQYFSKLHGPSRLPWASTLRGLVIHTADDFGAPGPDYRAGWGLMNTRKAAAFLMQNVLDNSGVLRELSIPNGQTTSIQIKAREGVVTPIRVTIAWSDPAATPGSLSVDNSAVRLVNDVDLWITKPGGALARPYILSRTSPANAATTGVNSVDNVEQVVIDSPTPGETYTINIAPASGETFVNENGAPAAQDVSVFISGSETDSLGTKLVWTGGSSYSLTWLSKVGAIYRAETSTDLFDWAEISGDLTTTTTQTASFSPSSTSGDKRFWRVKRIN